MHEFSVTQQILDVVLNHAEESGAGRVTRIELVIGEMTGFVDDSIQLCFDALSLDTAAQGAELVFRRVPVRARCRSCGAEFEPEEMDWRCRQCEALGGEVIAGRELYVDSIDVE